MWKRAPWTAPPWFGGRLAEPKPGSMSLMLAARPCPRPRLPRGSSEGEVAGRAWSTCSVTRRTGEAGRVWDETREEPLPLPCDIRIWTLFFTASPQGSLLRGPPAETLGNTERSETSGLWRLVRYRTGSVITAGSVKSRTFLNCLLCARHAQAFDAGWLRPDFCCHTVFSVKTFYFFQVTLLRSYTW